MAKKLEQIVADLPAKRRAAVEARAGNLATLKDLRQAGAGGAVSRPSTHGD